MSLREALRHKQLDWVSHRCLYTCRRIATGPRLEQMLGPLTLPALQPLQPKLVASSTAY